MEKKTILVVDDDPIIARMIKSRLEANRYSVVVAQDGDEGLQKLESQKPDLVVLDIIMPKIDGYTFVREMKKKEELKQTPVIILTAKGGMKDLFEVEGVIDYVLKPYEPEELLEKIRKHLE